MARLAFNPLPARAGAPVRVTRSRHYHSDDNAHVEQKNWMWPRQLLGYDRLEDPQLVLPIKPLNARGACARNMRGGFE
jgi:hypothetical protein